jgi:hypothetical protein
MKIEELGFLTEIKETKEVEGIKGGQKVVELKFSPDLFDTSKTFTGSIGKPITDPKLLPPGVPLGSTFRVGACYGFRCGPNGFTTPDGSFIEFEGGYSPGAEKFKDKSLFISHP